MSEIEIFRAEIERFIEEQGITPTAFGKKYAGDPLFVFQVRGGREPRTETRVKVLEAMRADDGAKAAAE